MASSAPADDPSPLSSAALATTRYVSFASAGTRGAVYDGFLNALEDHLARGGDGDDGDPFAQWRDRLLGVAGTSSGCIAALALALGVPRAARAAALREFGDLRAMLPVPDLARLYREHGADAGQGLRDCVARLLTRGGLSPSSTLGDLRRLLRLDLLCVATDLRTSTSVVLGGSTTPHVRVVDAVYASCCLPFAFVPLRWEGRLLVDGCLLDRLPNLFEDEERTLFVTVATDDGTRGWDALDTWPGFLQALLATNATLQHGAQRALTGPVVVLDDGALRGTEALDLGMTSDDALGIAQRGYVVGTDRLADGRPSRALGALVRLVAAGLLREEEEEEEWEEEEEEPSSDEADAVAQEGADRPGPPRASR